MSEKKIKPLKPTAVKKKKAATNKPAGVDFALYPQPLSFGMKIAQLWWVVPNSYILKKLEVRKKRVMLELWNGKVYEFGANDFESKFELDKYGFRRLDINLIHTKEKIKIKEMFPMYPNGREDFSDLITLFGAEKGTWTKIAEGINEIAKNLKEYKEIIMH
jgi:hypothetical protein